jgi:hypothetical protein
LKAALLKLKVALHGVQRIAQIPVCFRLRRIALQDKFLSPYSARNSGQQG